MTTTIMLRESGGLYVIDNVDRGHTVYTDFDFYTNAIGNPLTSNDAYDIQNALINHRMAEPGDTFIFIDTDGNPITIN